MRIVMALQARFDRRLPDIVTMCGMTTVACQQVVRSVRAHGQRRNGDLPRPPLRLTSFMPAGNCLVNRWMNNHLPASRQRTTPRVDGRRASMAQPADAVHRAGAGHGNRRQTVSIYIYKVHDATACTHVVQKRAHACAGIHPIRTRIATPFQSLTAPVPHGPAPWYGLCKWYGETNRIGNRYPQ
jgi:hypothetical protein